MGEERKVGENFDADKASDIFDKLKNVEGKTKTKKEDSKLKNIANLMNEAKYLEGKGKLDEAIDLYDRMIEEARKMPCNSFEEYYNFLYKKDTDNFGFRLFD